VLSSTHGDVATLSLLLAAPFLSIADAGGPILVSRDEFERQCVAG
jgi:hypothetical protein